MGPWQLVLVDLILPDNVYMSDFYTGELIWLVGNALSDSEISTLVCHLLDTQAELTRGALAECGENNSGTSLSIAQRLERSQILQIISVLSDQTIATCLEDLVKYGQN